MDDIILAIHTSHSIKGTLYSKLIDCENFGKEIVPVNILYERVTGRLMVKQVGEDYFLTYEYHSKKKNRFYILVNRLINIICGFLGVLLTLIIIPFVILGNLLFSSGPLLYTQTRMGRNGREFTIYKFRTMVVNAEEKSGAVWSYADDPRITKMGKLLRKSRIDELPQFLNVLKGDMNLIGPRPERPSLVGKLQEKIAFYNSRHLVKPGITGWAQVNYDYGTNIEDALKKLQYDLYYIKYRSLGLDLTILLKTIGVVLRFKGT